MHSNGVIVQSSQLSQLGINKQVLKNGSSVLVRVIGNNGNGKYTGSIAGVRVNLSSEKPLKIGSSFVATVTGDNGKIFVTPKNNLINQNPIQLSVLTNEQLLSFLNAFGLPQDKVSLALFQQFKQLNLKLDPSLMNRLHNLSVKFKGKEKSASEILLILNQKGIDASEEEILQLLTLIENHDDTEQKADDQEKGKQLINHLNRNVNGWLLLPFELRNIFEDEVAGYGCIRLLFNQSQELKLMNINCNYCKNQYLFSVGFDNKRISVIKMNIDNLNVEKIEASLLYLKSKFLHSGMNIKIEWADKEEIEGSACGSEEFLSFQGRV